MTRLGVIGHRGYAHLTEVLRRLEQVAPGLDLQLAFEPELHELAGGAVLTSPDEIDALLTLGGDGTLLRGARFLQGYALPILGVNLGRLGFLTTCSAGEMEMALDAFSRGEFRAEARMTLDARVLDVGGNERRQWQALNDVVLHKGGFARVVRLRITVNAETVAAYAADGIVVSTPTGSTAYSLSTGGPVVVPTVESILLTPVSPHMLAIRPLLLAPSAEVRVRAEDGPEELLVTVDGQVGTTFAAGEELRVCRSSHPVLIVRFADDSFFWRMRRKLGWGGPVAQDDES